jgi:hypothetical protein
MLNQKGCEDDDPLTDTSDKRIFPIHPGKVLLEEFLNPPASAGTGRHGHSYAGQKNQIFSTFNSEPGLPAL